MEMLKLTNPVTPILFVMCASVVCMAELPSKAPELKDHDLYVSGTAGRLHVNDSAGRNVPVIFVPSLGGTDRQWQAQADHLHGRHRVILVELRGHGKSDAPSNGDYSLEAMANDIHAIVETLSLKRVVLVGHSMGGGVALAYAAEHPDRVAGLLLVDPIDDPHLHPGMTKAFIDRLQSENYESEIVGRWNTILEGAKPKVKKIVLADLLSTPRETILGSMREMENFDASAAVAKYPGPMVSVVTRFNNVASALHKISNHVRAIQVDNTSHWLQMDAPAEFNRIMDDFLLRTGS